jgi:hypothetical protein
LARAEEALVKSVIKRLTRADWIATLVVINLGLIFAAVAIALGFGAFS